MTTRLASYLPALLLLPAILLHELTHAVVAWRWADVDIASYVPPVLELSYIEGTPMILVRIANVAPTIVGMLLSPLVILWALELTPVVATYVFGSWLVYTQPSAKDLFAVPVSGGKTDT